MPRAAEDEKFVQPRPCKILTKHFKAPERKRQRWYKVNDKISPFFISEQLDTKVCSTSFHQE
ncbi:hypothetical protein K0M31_006340 [Melipona bicolor]|uniref:Uncharacterized protein n=1 Tax=Melipona bicolor TaxID=60889 RepID=A0AA40FTF3_9HYME|nr:hypothetical protein K0M31_006340 [Melipona bicolor]